MKRKIRFGLFVLMFSSLTAGNGHKTSTATSQQNTGTNKILGGGCEGCELMYIETPDTISAVHTGIGWKQGNQELILTGKVFQLDGKTAAPNVIIYYWHTDDNGLYSANDQTPKQAKAQGNLRG